MYSRSMSTRVCAFVGLLGFTLLVLLYVHFEDEIASLEAGRKDLEQSLARLQVQEIEHWRKAPWSLDSTEERHPLEHQVVIYNRVPKTGSTSFMGLAYDLCVQNRFNVLHINVTKNFHVFTLTDQLRFVYNVTTWVAKKPALYHGHMAYVDFGKFGVAEHPIYINILRKPLDRLVSYFYFLRHGDDFRPNVVRRKQGDKKTFDECVMQGLADCDPDNMWLQIPFFCGQHADCWVPGNEWALEQAKHTLVRHYLVVGVTEEMGDFVTLLEVTLPRFFTGATELYNTGKKSHLRRTAQKIPPSQETVHRIQTSKVWKMENEFYEFALEHFHFMKKKTLTVKDGIIQDKGQRFKYEKIRPK